MKFIRKKTYYRDIVYEFNLPTGFSCPYADECLVKVDRITGKFDNKSKAYKCYSASAERFPAVREHRWNNFEEVQNGGIPIIPKNCKSVRIHSSGDFFSQKYFDMWLEICRENPDVEFWAYTKSLPYWLKRRSVIPQNLILTASKGGRWDSKIAKYDLKYAVVIPSPDKANGMPIDYNDDLARLPEINFCLLDNNKNSKKSGAKNI